MAGVVWSLFSLHVIVAVIRHSETRRTFSDNMELHLYGLYATWKLNVTALSFLQMKSANYSDLKGFTFDVFYYTI